MMSNVTFVFKNGHQVTLKRVDDTDAQTILKVFLHREYGCVEVVHMHGTTCVDLLDVSYVEVKPDGHAGLR